MDTDETDLSHASNLDESSSAKPDKKIQELVITVFKDQLVRQ